MMALCNSSVINGDSFARICFVSIGEYLIVKYWNIISNFIEIVLLKHSRSRSAKIKFADIHPKFFIIKMFLVPMVYYFRKSYFKLLSPSVSWKVPIQTHYCVENNLIDLQRPTLGLRQFLAVESPLKRIKNAFYFMLKARFVLNIFTFLS